MQDTTQAPTIHNGAHTIVNEATGEHRTFEIKTKLEKSNFAPGARVLSLLTGPDNTNDYSGFAFVNPTGVNVWKSKRGAGKPSAFDVYALMLWSLATKGEASPWYARGYRLKTERRCLCCNRRLTDPESIDRGIGPECFAKGGGR